MRAEAGDLVAAIPLPAVLIQWDERIAATVVVHCRMTVVDLEEAIVFYLRKFLSSERPPEVGVIDVGRPLDLADRVDVLLNRAHQRVGMLGDDKSVDIDSVDVHGTVFKARGDFLSRNQNEGFVDDVRQGRRVGEHVVVGEHQEVVAVLLVPGGDLLRRRITIALKCMRVSVPLEPCHSRRIAGFEPEATRLRSQRRRRRKKGCNDEWCYKDNGSCSQRILLLLLGPFLPGCQSTCLDEVYILTCVDPGLDDSGELGDAPPGLFETG